MAENKMRKHYRDKFLKKFNMKARDIPVFNTVEEYEKFYREKLYEERQKEEYLDQLKEAGLLPDESDLALSKLNSMFYKYEKAFGGENPMYVGLEKLLKKFKRMDRSLRRRLLRNAAPEAIEAVENIIKIIPSDPDAFVLNDEEHKAESAILVLQKVLSGGEIMSMGEAVKFFSNKDNYETN